MYFFEKVLRTENGVVTVPECFQQDVKRLVLLVCRNDEATVAYYVSALRAGHAIMLVDYTLHIDLLRTIIQQYSPYYIIGIDKVDGYNEKQGILYHTRPMEVKINEDLAVLLSTSGTTGSPKFVRLSYDNLQSNAEAIVTYLSINTNERAIMNLPLSYSYGMSIVNSHMQAGATLLLIEQSVIEKGFWSYIQEQHATSLAGVPFTYQMLLRIGFMKMDLPYLKTLTQAGGRLNEKEVLAFARYAKEKNKYFYVMYGQTEAAPRMSYIPYELLNEKSGTIGIAVPGGRFDIDRETSELIYYGDNVMMGYAESITDLAKGDELGGVLHTGDTAVVDKDGYYTITGRLKRFIKLFGLRINLDDVERKLEAEGFNVACTGKDDKLIIVTTSDVADIIRKLIQSWYHLHNSGFCVHVLEEFPRFSNGKLNYNALKELYL
ncbi:AMP-binding protein [Lysinibacillus sp. NPDC058147]|uniref:AMP-binding protein n=1 Tax=unclassified Lysinibacillus TaxID=2636778 RepID=UPI0036DDC506